MFCWRIDKNNNVRYDIVKYIQIFKALFLAFLLGLTILPGILFATIGIDYIVNHEKYPDRWSLILLSGVVMGFGIGLLLVFRKKRYFSEN